MSKRTRAIEGWGFVRPSDRQRAPLLAGTDAVGVSWVSTPVASYDIERGIAVTESGREYTLIGPEMPSSAHRAFFDVWSLPDNVELLRVAPEDVAAAIAADISREPRTPEERAELDLAKVAIYGDKIAFFATFTRLTDADLARVLGISDDDFASYKRGIPPKGLSPEHAEKVFSFVVARMNGYNVPEPTPPVSAEEKARRRGRMADTAARMADRLQAIKRAKKEAVADEDGYYDIDDIIDEIDAIIAAEDDEDDVPPPGMGR